MDKKWLKRLNSFLSICLCVCLILADGSLVYATDTREDINVVAEVLEEIAPAQETVQEAEVTEAEVTEAEVTEAEVTETEVQETEVQEVEIQETEATESQVAELDYILGRPMTAEEEQEQREIMQRYTQYDGIEITEQEHGELTVTTEEPLVMGTLPSTYDSRNVNGTSYVTNIKSQGSYGVCWAFGSVSCVESSLIKNNYADTSIDLSESHVAYFSNFGAPDILGNDYNDDMYHTGEYLHVGGNASMASHALLNWKGAVREDYAPYSKVADGFERTTEVAYLQDIVHLEGYYHISKDDPTSIKKAIMDYGSVWACYYAGDNYLQPSTAAYYCDRSDLGTNHAITIVGWDDNYSKNNFALTPSTNGAWLVKNSWGTWWGDDGYFWLSYEDASLYQTLNAFDAALVGNYDNNYQYDHTHSSVFWPVTQAANVFEVKANGDKKEELKAVGIDLSHSANINYSIQIYKNPTDDVDPTSGEAMLTTPKTGSTTLAGFYTVPLDQTVVLEPGDSFAVVVDVVKADGTKAYISLERTLEGDRVCVASAEENQSYMNHGYGWIDTATKGGNLRIKAYTDNLDEQSVKCTGVTLDKSTLTLYAGSSAQLTATVEPTNATNKEVAWTSSNVSVATVDENGKITAKGEGTATITVTTLNGGFSASCVVTVKPIKVTGIKLNKSELTLEKGSRETLVATVIPSNATNSVCKWKSEDTSVATVTDAGVVIANAAGTTTVTVTTVDGGYVASCEVTVTVPVTYVWFGYAKYIDSTTGEYYVRVGDTLKLNNIYISPSNATDQTLTWTSSNPNIATVDSNGTLKPKAEGTVTITATSSNGVSHSETLNVRLPKGAYIGNINSELISFDLKQSANGGYYLTGEIVVVEWVDGKSTVPKDAPTMIFKATDGSEEIEVFVTATGTNTYYFDRFIEGLSADKEYVFEIASGNSKNVSPNRSMNVLLSTSPKMLTVRNLGKIGEQKICYRKADNGELRLYRRTNPYIGNINSELIKTELVTGPNGNYVSGQIVVVEWVDGVSTVPFDAPIMYFRSTDGKEVLPVFVTPTGTNTYYFDRSLGDLDTSKEYVFTIESGDELNESPYRSMVVTTAAMKNKQGTLWQSSKQYVRYRTDANTGELRIYGVNK